MDTPIRTRNRHPWRAALVLLTAMTLAAVGGLPVAASADSGLPVAGQTIGLLPDGTVYGIQVPENWNGVVINDLDSVAKTGSDLHQLLLDQGFALSGTRRHSNRELQYDPSQEIRNQVRVLDIFEAKYGKPDRTLQFGCSGGGAVAMGMGEAYPDKVDGVIPVGYQTGIVIGNMWLDLLFTLKALLAPESDLPVVGITKAEEDTAGIAWSRTLDAAQQTEEGRARIALAVTLSQWPTWGSFFPQFRWNAPGSSSPEKPDPNDVNSLQKAMYYSALDGMRAAVTNRDLLENGAGGIPSWNAGVDYRRFYSNADPAQADVVRKLYLDSGLSIDDELTRIDRQPRIAGDPAAVDYWRVHPRTHAGRPSVPVLHVHTIGDAALPPAIMEGYAARARTEGNADLYRQAFIDATDHCSFNRSEVVALIETMLHRIERGSWEDTTTPEQLNALGRGFGVDEPRFIRHRLTELNRAFYSDSEYPGD